MPSSVPCNVPSFSWLFRCTSVASRRSNDKTRKNIHFFFASHSAMPNRSEKLQFDINSYKKYDTNIQHQNSLTLNVYKWSIVSKIDQAGILWTKYDSTGPSIGKITVRTRGNTS
jgi:hypothetical protein